MNWIIQLCTSVMLLGSEPQVLDVGLEITGYRIVGNEAVAVIVATNHEVVSEPGGAASATLISSSLRVNTVNSRGRSDHVREPMEPPRTHGPGFRPHGRSGSRNGFPAKKARTGWDVTSATSELDETLREVMLHGIAKRSPEESSVTLASPSSQ